MKYNDYKYGIYPDVITQIELKRMLSPIGPTEGHLYRISDGKKPKIVAMIQCVGSRSLKVNPYCSVVCCSVALKNAQLLKHEYPDTEIVIFYIDLRTWDKGNEKYYRKVREAGVLTIRGKAGEIQEDQETKAIKLTAFDTLTNQIVNLNAYLVVLSTGMIPSKYSAKLTETLSMSSDSYGFLSEIHGCLKPQETTNMGVYMCGCAAGPKKYHLPSQQLQLPQVRQLYCFPKIP